MTLLTYVTIITNYPDGLIIDSSLQTHEGYCVGWIYLKNPDGSIHRPLINTKPTKVSKDEMITFLHSEVKQWIETEQNRKQSNESN